MGGGKSRVVILSGFSHEGNLNFQVTVPPDLDALFVYELQSKHSSRPDLCRGLSSVAISSSASSLRLASLFFEMTSKDISREDILVFLSSMGVVLSKDTKMPLEDLNKRLGNALDASQQFDQLIGTKTVDPSEFTLWTGKDILKASHRHNIQESFTGTGAMSQQKKGPLSAKEDTFRELRQSVLAIAQSCDEDHTDIYYMDGEEKWAIFVRVCPNYILGIIVCSR